MDSRSKTLVKRVMEAGEAQIDRMVGQLLVNERFVGAVQGVVATSLAAKGSLDKSLRSALASMNLPSTADVAELSRRLDRMERVLAELDDKLGRLEGASKAAKPAAAKSGARAAKPTAEAGPEKAPPGKAAPRRATGRAPRKQG